MDVHLSWILKLDMAIQIMQIKINQEFLDHIAK